MKVLAAVLLLIALVLALTVRLYQVQEADYGYSLLWSDKEAVLIVASRTLGWNASVAGWVVRTFQALSGYGFAASDVRSQLNVFEIRPGGVQRFMADGMGPSSFGVLVDRVSDGKSSWEGQRFVPASDEERNLSVGHLVPREFSDQNGWSKRSSLRSQTTDIPFTVGGSNKTLRVVGAIDQPVEIILDRDGKSESLWKIDPKASLVSGETYRKAFAAKAR